MGATIGAFIDSKVRNLVDRARRLARLDPDALGLREQDMPYAPSASHFEAANARLLEIDRAVLRQLSALEVAVKRSAAAPEVLLQRAALVEREVDRLRRAFGLFFEVFSQRGTRFAQPLAACDAIAVDCFQVVRRNAPGLLPPSLLKPVTYLEHGFSPATFRRGVVLSRLLGESNPFPLVRVPYERVESPWGMGVLLHEIGHNLQADLRVWHETRVALQRRLLAVTADAWVTRLWTRWHRELFADVASILLGGPASARSMADFLAYPASRVFAFRPLGVHPVPYLRVFIHAELLRRMGFAEQARAAQRAWRSLYGASASRGRAPAALLVTAPRVIPHVIDEIAFQPRRGLGERALADVIPYSDDDERRVRAAARSIAVGEVPHTLAPRLVVSASRVAFEERLAEPAAIATTVLQHLARSAPDARGERAARRPAAA